MQHRIGPVIDMTPDGAFISPPRTTPTLGAILTRLAGFAILLGVAVVAFWAALFVIPVLILLGVAGYATARLFGGRSGGAIIRRF